MASLTAWIAALIEARKDYGDIELWAHIEGDESRHLMNSYAIVELESGALGCVILETWPANLKLIKGGKDANHNGQTGKEPPPTPTK